MHRILLSFIGNNDCLLPEKKGAIIAILEQRSFDRLYLLYNDESYLRPASALLDYCRHHLDVRYQPALAADPTDYNTVYPAMYQAVRMIVSENKAAAFTISVTSGTPTMHACWIFLRQGGIIDAELIQVHRESGISAISFVLDDFPKIKNQNIVKTELTKLVRENKNLRAQLQLRSDEIIGESAAIAKVREQIAVLARTDLPVFISGESGTGKELVAAAIHFNSPRCERPFIKVNCGAISPQLFESEFFGHRKGSFSGAIANQSGKIMEADGGTLLLDEIGDLPLEMQVKLLRFLDSGTIQIVGGGEAQADVRVISATNRDIRQLTREKRFRDDLFYRLVQAEIGLPPLRDRGDDVILIARHILEGLNRKHDQHKTLHPSALAVIRQNRWSGNIRQLKNCLQTAFAFARDEITAETLRIIDVSQSPAGVYLPPEGIDLENDLLPGYYRMALEQAQQNATRAAHLLGLEPATFRARLRKLGIRCN